ncbi:hypothetical protein RN607_05565 [Demequina capsici]|uniref:Uncharacterized protein n=1 Tax=Demequina capsici TaxID=3075620 RepID=A0AA96JBI5_9MICO|nr:MULTISPECIES: hypothetical protein [unclassified Demequina]WNM25564.1 hypothetical protein RN606_05305 [Demequina sp. OYTSA14]WNM28470.1 hypothetical protein RN607_05565 [Demequina sp. PMTSA13]
MDGPKRGGGEIITGLLIALIGAPVAGVPLAFLGLQSGAVALVVLGAIAAIVLFWWGVWRAVTGARIYLHTTETAALIAIHGADAVARLDAGE